MNTLDLVILTLAVAAAVGGYRLGFLARAASWLGLGLGLFVAVQILPWLFERFDDMADVNLLLLASGVLVGGAFLGQATGYLIGTRLHLALPHGSARQVDRIGGAVAGLVGVALAVWMLTPVLVDTPEWPARQARTSAVVELLDGVLPTPPETARELSNIIREDFGRVFADLRPAPELGPPPAESGLTQALAEQVAASTVKVEGQACSRVQDGSGAVVGSGLIVTNAHVVAGADAVHVQRHPDGAQLHAEVVAFDPNRDLAILSVPDIDRPALNLGDAEEGSIGAVFGHPGGGPLEISPYQIGEEVRATGTDIYDSNATVRQIFVLAAELRPGDSGSALIDGTGSVVGVAFAVAPDRPNVGYALTNDELNAVLGDVSSGAVSTGPCLR